MSTSVLNHKSTIYCNVQYVEPDEASPIPQIVCACSHKIYKTEYL